MRIKRLLYGVLILSAATWCGPRAAIAQATTACGPAGYRVLGSQWDAVLRMNWELRQDCAHPEWPARSVATVAGAPASGSVGRLLNAVPIAQPLLVHAGEPVKLWEQDAMVRIEMGGVAEESARMGERVVVQISRQNDDGGIVVDRIEGVVRGAGNVEMER